MDILIMQLRQFCRRFDRAVSQKRVGLWGQNVPGNHSSLKLSERGPALKVFWSRQWRDGRFDKCEEEKTKKTKTKKL